MVSDWRLLRLVWLNRVILRWLLNYNRGPRLAIHSPINQNTTNDGRYQPTFITMPSSIRVRTMLIKIALGSRII